MSLPLSFTWRARRPSRAPREIPPEGCVGLVRAFPERPCAARRLQALRRAAMPTVGRGASLDGAGAAVLAVPQAAAHNFYVLALEMRACLATMRGYFEELSRSLVARMLLFFECCHASSFVEAFVLKLGARLSVSFDATRRLPVLPIPLPAARGERRNFVRALLAACPKGEHIGLTSVGQGVGLPLRSVSAARNT